MIFWKIGCCRGVADWLQSWKLFWEKKNIFLGPNMKSSEILKNTSWESRSTWQSTTDPMCPLANLWMKYQKKSSFWEIGLEFQKFNLIYKIVQFVTLFKETCLNSLHRLLLGLLWSLNYLKRLYLHSIVTHLYKVYYSLLHLFKMHASSGLRLILN